MWRSIEPTTGTAKRSESDVDWPVGIAEWSRSRDRAKTAAAGRRETWKLQTLVCREVSEGSLRVRTRSLPSSNPIHGEVGILNCQLGPVPGASPESTEPAGWDRDFGLFQHPTEFVAV